jgi:hypothetical protein
MSQGTSKLTTVMAGLALASLPVLLGAQGTPSPKPEQTTPPSTTSQPGRATDQSSPQHHLDEAKKALNGISTSSLKGDAQTQVAELRRNFTQLESAWLSKSAASARSGAAGTGHLGNDCGHGSRHERHT